MIPTKIWQRYFLKEILKTFFLFLLCFFMLYALIEYSVHMQEIIKNKNISIPDLITYYGMLFSKRCHLLLPLSLLVASVKALISFNQHSELLAFQTAGIPMHHLTRPFFLVGLICVGLNYGNLELLSLKSLNYVDHFEQNYLKKKNSKKTAKQGVHILPLEDGTRLLYQRYDHEKKEFFDLFWIVSTDEIYHMKTLKTDPSIATGTFVDHLARNEAGEIKKVASYRHISFNNLTLNYKLETHLNTPIKNRPITHLISMTRSQTPFYYGNLPTIQTHLYFKLFMPWLPVLILIGVIPFCVPSTRSLPIFLIFSIAIFGYIAFFTLMDGCVILGETGVISPFWAIFTLPIIFLIIFGIRFIKMCVKRV